MWMGQIGVLKKKPIGVYVLLLVGLCLVWLLVCLLLMQLMSTFPNGNSSLATWRY
jgi:hypothetical protein